MTEHENDLVLEVRGLSVRIGSGPDSVRPVEELDLTIRRGETHALLGESGCGKSMTALAIMRLLPPSARITAGEVLLDRIDLPALSEKAMRRERGGRVGMIFQEPMTSLNPVMTVGRQIGEAVELHDAENRKRIDARVVELLKAVGIPDPERRAQEYPHQLSGGMKQRVMIAMALAGRPKLLIADEPTTALDVTIQAQVLALLKDLQRKTGMAVLLITHDLGVVAEVADRVAVMYAGQIVENAARQAFFARPRHPYSHKLFEALPTTGKRNRALAVIPGNVPSLDRDFEGCRFADRCQFAEPRCTQSPAPWKGEMEQGFRCHLEPAARPVEEMQTVDTSAKKDGAEPLLEVTDLQVHFPIRRGFFKRTVGQVKAVDGIDIRIDRGRTLALVGESGCGKTTAGKSILQLIPPTAGSVLFEGEDLANLKGKALRRRRADFQIIFQDPASSMNPRMLVEDIVAEGLAVQRIGADRDERRQRVVELLDKVGISENALKRYPHEFSGGQRQRIAIARALVLRPKLVVCDEPTSALDVSVQAQILNLLGELQRDMGLAYLFITHNLSVVSYLADEVAVMYLGRIVERGTVQEVMESPRHPYTQALLSAVPRIDPKTKREVIHLEGDMPSPSDPPAGCHFHPRCPRAQARCREGYPTEETLSATHRVRCFLHDTDPQ